MRIPDDRYDLSEVTILSHNIAVNPKLFGRINRLTGMGIYGLWVRGLTMVKFMAFDCSNPNGGRTDLAQNQILGY